MTDQIVDPLYEHIYNGISTLREISPCSSNKLAQVKFLTSNIAFLIKYHAGPKVTTSRVSVSIVDFSNPISKRRVTVCLHRTVGKSITILSEEDSQDGNLLMKLRMKIDNAVLEILEKKGNKGYGDIKDPNTGSADVELVAGSHA